MVERIGYQLLRRPSVDGASKPKFQMAFAIKSQRERGLVLASWHRSSAWRTAQRRSRSRSGDRYNSHFGLNFDRDGFGLVMLQHRFGFRVLEGRFWRAGLKALAWLIGLGGFVDFVLFDLVPASQALDNFRLLVVNRRMDRGEAECVTAWVLGDFVAKDLGDIARDLNRLWRFETHVVPAEILKPVTGLTKSLRPHRGARRTLSSKETRRKRRKRLGFCGHLDPPH